MGEQGCRRVTASGLEYLGDGWVGAGSLGTGLSIVPALFAALEFSTCLKSAVGQSHKTLMLRLLPEVLFGRCPQACWCEGSCCGGAAVVLPPMTWLH